MTEVKELEEAKTPVFIEITDYMLHSVLSKTILKKTTGNLTVFSVAAGKELAEKTSRFANYIQISDGSA
jgi:hypothetical protein